MQHKCHVTAIEHIMTEGGQEVVNPLVSLLLVRMAAYRDDNTHPHLCTLIVVGTPDLKFLTDSSSICYEQSSHKNSSSWKKS